MTINHQFTTQEILAIRYGRKTQFRVLVEPKPVKVTCFLGYRFCFKDNSELIGPPYQPGDLIQIDAATSVRVTSVRVERLHEISDGDASAEGFTEEYEPPCVIGGEVFGPDCCTAKQQFTWHWEANHGPGSWVRNDWVWVYEIQLEESAQ